MRIGKSRGQLQPKRSNCITSTFGKSTSDIRSTCDDTQILASRSLVLRHHSVNGNQRINCHRWFSSDLPGARGRIDKGSSVVNERHRARATKWMANQKHQSWYLQSDRWGANLMEMFIPPALYFGMLLLITMFGEKRWENKSLTSVGLLFYGRMETTGLIACSLFQICAPCANVYPSTQSPRRHEWSTLVKWATGISGHSTVSMISVSFMRGTISWRVNGWYSVVTTMMPLHSLRSNCRYRGK